MKNNPSQAVPSEQGVSPEEGGGNVSSQEDTTLQVINEATGRNYKTLEDAQKGIKETYNYVGKKTQNEESYQDDVAQKVKELEFAFNHPEAKDVASDVAAIAQAKGLSLEEAFENSFAKQFVEGKKQEQEPVNPPYVEGGKLPEGKKGISKEEFRNLPFEEQQKIVRELPSWNEPIGK